MAKMATSYLIVGKIGAPHGIKGWLKIQAYTEMSSNILEYTPWYVTNHAHEYHTIDIESARMQGKTILVKFSTVNSPEEARSLTGKKIFISRAQLPKLKNNEYYWSDLEGLTVYNKQGEEIGNVIYLMETGSNDVLIVKGLKEQAIPYLPSVILNIDLDKKIMIVDWEELS